MTIFDRNFIFLTLATSFSLLANVKADVSDGNDFRDDLSEARREVGRQVRVNSSGVSSCLADGTTVNSIFTPVTLIHSNGKAYTECQDRAEQQQSLQGRQVCVNSNGDYYFLAD